jgi:ATP-dependent RNA helicase DDX55/SPB4
LFVTEEERTYIEFLKGRGVPMNEMTCINYNSSIEIENKEENNNDNILITPPLWIDTIHNAMKQCACTDRGVLEAGSTAFMSFLRAYKEHICSYIFRFDQLDIGAVAKSYALLRLPKIPETRGVRGRAIVFESTDINTSTIPYKHKEKEQARLRRLQTLIDDKAKEEEQALLEKENPSNNSNSLDKKKEDKKVWIPSEEYVVPEDSARKRKKKQSHEQKIMDEWSEMAAEEAAYKKFKKGKLTKDEYQACLIAEDAPEMDEDGDILVSGKNGPTASILKKYNKQEGGDDSDDDSIVDSDDSENEGEKIKKSVGGITKQSVAKDAKQIPKVLHPVLSMMHGMHGKKKGKHLTFSRGGSSGSGVKKRGK